MKRVLKMLVLAAAALAAQATRPSDVLAQQFYECVTTTRTTTSYAHDVYGNIYITSVTVRQTICVLIT